MEIFPSLISSDLLNLEKTIKLLDPVCNGYHIDVMDDHFVPNLTWGPAFVKAIGQVTRLPIHLHLMVDNPASWVDRIELRARDTFIFHIEAMESDRRIRALIQDAKNKGWKVGIAINPKTEANRVFDYLKDIDHILVMSVEPGFSGQKFIPEVLQKIDPLLQKKEELKSPTFEKREEEYTPFKIGMDGGISKSNLATLAEIGIDQIGVATSIFGEKDPKLALEELYSILTRF